MRPCPSAMIAEHPANRMSDRTELAPFHLQEQTSSRAISEWTAERRKREQP